METTALNPTLTRKAKNERLTTAQKNAQGKKWYKDKVEELDTLHRSSLGRVKYGHSEFKNMKINYDLFNNKMDPKDFEHVTKPFGDGVGELPAELVNRDIVSGKIKALLGMEMKRPFNWRVIATNKEATTRKEQHEFGMVRDFVTSQILTPIRQRVELKVQEQVRGRELSTEEAQQLQMQIEEETKALTPPEIKKYMLRDHQDPAEVMSSQLMEYLIHKTDAPKKFNDGFKHMNLSGMEAFYVGILNGEPTFWNVNSVRFTYKPSFISDFIEDGESAACEYRMTPSEVMRYFGDQLTNPQIDKIYSDASYYTDERILDSLFEFRDYVEEDMTETVRVVHGVWKGLRLIQFLTYLDEDGDEQMMMVGEEYELNPENGDLYIEKEWIPESYETWKIGSDTHVNMRPIPGQFKDLDNIYECKLPYYGISIDNMNSEATCPMDRIRNFQFFYNILWYRIELLFATDKGKKLLMNIGAVPDTAAVNMKNWEYFFETTPFAWFDPAQEGSNFMDANNIAKVVDMSLASQIDQYIGAALALRQQAGESIGVTEQVEGQISGREAVGNVQQNLIQTSHILEPYFDSHNHVKRNVLQALIETAKIAYSQYGEDKLKLSYIADDMTQKLLTLDVGLLDNSTLGIFVSDSVELSKIKEGIDNLAHAALQTEKAEFSDVIKVLRAKSIEEAEETLVLSEKERKEFEMKMMEEKRRAEAQAMEQANQMREKEMEHEKDIIKLKEKERRETELMKAAVMGMSFNPDQDADNDGVNDFLELYRDGMKADIEQRKVRLDEKRLEHDKEVDKKKLKIEEKKVNKQTVK